MESTKRSFKNTSLLILGFVLGIIISSLFFNLLPNSAEAHNRKLSHDAKPHESDPNSVNFSTFRKVWTLIQRHHISHPFKDAKLYHGAIKGMVRSTGDPYTYFFTKKEYKEYQQTLSGNFVGIGVYIEPKNGYIQVVSPIEGSPADKAGLRAGDLIIKVDGKDIHEMPLHKAINLIKGKRGTKVTLTIVRKGVKKPFNVVIVRDVIKIKSVTSKLRKDGYLYIRIKMFGQETAGDLVKVSNSITGKKVKGIILDLRNNPGGYLRTAQQVAGQWIFFKTVVVVKTAHDEPQNYTSWGFSRFANKPTILLINKGSASASEIIAGAFKDHKVATLIGTKTYGKGSVQQIMPLSDGSAVKITIAKFFTPNGKVIDKKGVTPHIVVKITEDDIKKKKDPQMARAIEVLNKLTKPKKKKVVPAKPKKTSVPKIKAVPKKNKPEKEIKPIPKAKPRKDIEKIKPIPKKK